MHLLHCCVFVNTCAYNLSSVYRSSARQLHLFITRAHFSPSFVAHHLNASCFTNNAVVSPCTSPILCTDNMVNTTVIDGRGHLLGRLASTVAKELLNGTVSTALHYGSSHSAQEKKVKKEKNREEKKKRRWLVHVSIGRRCIFCGGGLVLLAAFLRYVSTVVIVL